MVREEMIQMLVAKEIQAMDEGVHGFDYFIQKYYATRSSFELEEEIQKLDLKEPTQEVKEYGVEVTITLIVPIEASTPEEAERKARGMDDADLWNETSDFNYEYQVYLGDKLC